MSTDQSRIEYAVRLTWPDGHSEIAEPSDRAAAEFDVRRYNQPGSASFTADLVSRTVTVTDWEPAS
jgi:hypothetical protein